MIGCGAVTLRRCGEERAPEGRRKENETLSPRKVGADAGRMQGAIRARHGAWGGGDGCRIRAWARARAWRIRLEAGARWMT